MELSVGDPVEVLDEGLAMLRRLCPGMPPNHHGVVAEFMGDRVLVQFDDSDQAAPYPRSQVRRREVRS